MGPILPIRSRCSQKSKIGLVDQCGRLQRVIGPLTRKSCARHLLQLFVDQRQEFARPVGAAVHHVSNDGGDVTWGRQRTTTLKKNWGAMSDSRHFRRMKR